MGMTPLALVGGTPHDTDRYSNWLEARLGGLSPLLVENPVWSDAIMNEVFGHSWLSQTYASLPLSAAVPVLTNEIKAYLAASVLDDRKADTQWFQRRIPVIRYLVEEGASLLQHFGAGCLADIPHPGFGASDGDTAKTKCHNDAVLELYATWYGEQYGRRRQSQTRQWIRDGEIVTTQYRSPEVQLFGDIHRFSIINRAQMAPMHDRDIIWINDLYSEEDTRFRDRQRRSDTYLNFLCFEPWLRPLMRGFLLDKVAHGELAPATLVGMQSRLRTFGQFLHGEGIAEPGRVTELTMERYLAWGNARNAAGKNWYTDIVQLLRAAPVLLPGQWPRIALDKRAARRIRYKQAPDDPRNRLYASREGANRAAPPEALAAMVARLDELPAPIPVIFMIGVTTGARAEDLHALLFDCLRPDPHDTRFMLFTFWQNKVSRWNTKPLLVTDPAHQAMIKLIEAQRDHVRQRYGRVTKYLFPVFSGKRESFLGYNWTLQELKMLCLRHGIVDGEGKPFDFSWHPLRHHRGTQMAAEGHDILSIMFELGHASPDMASMYVNKRLDLKKNALLRKGGGQFFTIAGKVDEAVGDLLLRKETMLATRVSGGACTLPGQLGEWCEHAHACLTCRFFRADGDDLEHFRCERAGLYVAIEGLEQEARDYEEGGQARMADITRKRLQRNKDAVHNTDTIIRSIEEHGLYKGQKQRYRPSAAREEPALRELGERGDIIRTMQKALGPQAGERDPMSFQIHDGAPETPIVGRVVDKHLSDELGENLTIVVDGIDGRTHHIAGITPERLEDARIGSVIQIGPAEVAPRPSDRTITAIAEDGIYRPSRHLEQAKFEGRVPGGGDEGYIDAHVRRLEALRRAGIVERIDADQWRIPDDLVSRAADYDTGRDRQASVRVLSPVDLQRQIRSDCATWLDRRLVHGETADLAPTGFGQQVREAMDQRREHHIEQRDATRNRDGRIFYRRNLLATLREREVARAGAEMAEGKALPFRAAKDGESVSGKFTGTVQLTSGKFAIVEKSHEFTLVPWRPIIDRQLGREVAGIMQGGSVSWQLGRQRGLGL